MSETVTQKAALLLERTAETRKRFEEQYRATPPSWGRRGVFLPREHRERSMI
jgi:hypothetical protein